MIEISQLNLSNFRCFPAAEIDFGKITLITGANSSGKSSIMYALLGLLQSSGFPFTYSTNGEYVDMGDFYEMAFLHDVRKEIGIGLRIRDGIREYDIHLKLINPDGGGIPVVKEFECHDSYFYLKLIGDVKGGHFMFDLDYDPKKNPDKYDEKLIDSILKDDTIEKGLTDDFVLIIRAFSKEFHLREEHFDANAQEDIKDEKLIVLFKVINEVTRVFRRFDEKFNFISSYRMPPERTYLERSVGKKIAPSGQGFVDILLKWRNSDPQRFERIISIMRSLKVLNDIQVERMKGGRFNVLVKAEETSPFASLSDVGFGVSQILPIVMADVELGDESTLYTAQPEIHLHPSVQADYASYAMEQAITSKKRYVIETHSEYLLNRIRLGIVQGHISEEEVKVYYLQQDNGITRIYQLFFKGNGQIIGAPEDFFQTYMMDVMNIAIEAAE